MKLHNLPTALATMLALMIPGCMEPCYDIFSVGRAPAGTDAEGWTIVDLDQEEDLSRFGVLIDMLEAARDPESHGEDANEFVADTRAKQQQWDRVMENLEELSLEQENATAMTIRYKGDLYHLVAIHGPGCVR